MEIKEIAGRFLKQAAHGKVQQAFDDFVTPGFIHHNQYFKGDRVSLQKAMAEAHRTDPNKSIAIKQLISEGNKVVSYSHVVKEEMDIAVVHIFRFENNKIAELWDLGQVIEKDSPNEYGLF